MEMKGGTVEPRNLGLILLSWEEDLDHLGEISRAICIATVTLGVTTSIVLVVVTVSLAAMATSIIIITTIMAAAVPMAIKLNTRHCQFTQTSTIITIATTLIITVANSSTAITT